MKIRIRSVVPASEIAAHRREIRAFSELVASDKVAFRALTCWDLFREWDASPIEAVRVHVLLMQNRFNLHYAPADCAQLTVHCS